MKKAFSILTVCTAAAMIVSLSACGEQKKSDSKETTAATTVATTAAAADSDTNNDNSDGNSSSDGSNSNAVSSGSQTNNDADSLNSDEYKNNVEQQAATQEVLQRAAELYGAGDWREVSSYKITDPTAPCWYVGVVNYSLAQSPTYYFYCNPGFFCYADESNSSGNSGNEMNDTSFAGISESDAGAKALGAVGDGNWTLTGCYQGTYQGVDAWAITLTNSDDGSTKLAYVGGDFCYFN